MMRKSWIALAPVEALAPLSAAPGPGVGESAPLPEAKEVIGLAHYGPRPLEGKVVFIELFRTW